MPLQLSWGWLPAAAAALLLLAIVSVSFDVVGMDLPDLKDVISVEFGP